MRVNYVHPLPVALLCCARLGGRQFNHFSAHEKTVNARAVETPLLVVESLLGSLARARARYAWHPASINLQLRMCSGAYGVADA
jgi:hypothetical protein